MVEACLQHNNNIGFQENEARIEKFHHSGGLFADY